MDATVERGRWGTKAVARIYINDALGREVEHLLAPHERGLIRTAVASLLRYLAERD